MLNIRVAEENDKNNIYDLMSEEGYNSINLDSDKLHNSMVVSDGGKIIGYSAYNKIPNRNIAIVEVLIIKSEFRGQYLGDGLIKSILNLADRRGITKVYVPAKSKNSSFFKKAGLTKRVFDKTNEVSTYIEANPGSDDIEAFEAVLPDFFNKACKSKR